LTQITTLIIGGSGILGFAATVYQTRQKSSTDTAHTEVEAAAQESADWSAFTDRIQKYMDYQDQQINSLRAEIESLKKERQADIVYVDLLHYWTWKRLPPPPPKRGDGYPDADQVGGEPRPAKSPNKRFRSRSATSAASSIFSYRPK